MLNGLSSRPTHGTTQLFVIPGQRPCYNRFVDKCLNKTPATTDWVSRIKIIRPALLPRASSEPSNQRLPSPISVCLDQLMPNEWSTGKCMTSIVKMRRNLTMHLRVKSLLYCGRECCSRVSDDLRDVLNLVHEIKHRR